MNMKERWLDAPDMTLGESVKNLIREKWDDEPTAIQLLEIVDHAVHWGAASDIAVKILDLYLRSALMREGKELEDILPLAVWRDA